MVHSRRLIRGLCPTRAYACLNVMEPHGSSCGRHAPSGSQRISQFAPSERKRGCHWRTDVRADKPPANRIVGVLVCRMDTLALRGLRSRVALADLHLG